MQSREQVEVEFTPVTGDFIRASWAIVRVSPGQWLIHFFPPLVGIVLLGVLAWSPLPVKLHHLLLGVALVVMVPALLAWNLWRVRSQCRRLCPMRYRFATEGLEIANRQEQLQQQWRAIRRVRLDQGLMLLYFGRITAHCVPLRLLEAPQRAAILGWAEAAGVRVPR